MTPERFFHVAVKPVDLAGSVAFYRDALELTVLDRGEDDVRSVALEVAAERVYCFDRAPYEAAGLVQEVPTGFLHFGFVIPDVDDAVADVTAAGADSLMEPERFDELRIAFVRGPSGTRVELLEEL